MKLFPSNKTGKEKLKKFMQTQFGVLMIAIGVVVVLIGVAAYFGGLSWFGNLPGDIKIERENMSVYIPIVSMLLISLVFSLISYILRRFF